MDTIGFIGGGNMATAIIGGLLKQPARPAPESVLVIDPGESQRAALERSFGVRTLPAPSPELGAASLVVWAVKPQFFRTAAAACAPFVANALHLSVMAGIRSDAIAAAVGSERVVRAMPNTPALIGQGMSGLYARAAVAPAERARVDAVLAATGDVLWVDREADLDAVTALSGSGPAYVFYVAEAMVNAACAMGLGSERGRRLALTTIAGSAALAGRSDEALATLRERVTSKGGTTAAAVAALEASGVGPAIEAAIEAARRRAEELGAEFG